MDTRESKFDAIPKVNTGQIIRANTIVLDRSHLLIDNRRKDIRTITITDFQYEVVQEIKQADYAMYLGQSGMTKIIKDRFGDRGRGVIGLIVDEIKDQISSLPPGTNLGEKFFEDIKVEYKK